MIDASYTGCSSGIPTYEARNHRNLSKRQVMEGGSPRKKKERKGGHEILVGRRIIHQIQKLTIAGEN